MSGVGTARDARAIWHNLECAAYTADLQLWRGLAKGGGPVLELGCGTGRVGLWLARAGHRVTGLDADPCLVEAFNRRAGGLPAAAQVGGATEFSLGDEFGLALAPMQLVQLLANAAERLDCLACVARHLRPGGRLALAIVDGLPDRVDGDRTADGESGPPLPDACELGGWIYSSLPLETVLDGDTIVVRRLRQTVSPAGALSEELSEIGLCVLTAAELEREATTVGLRPAGRLEVPPTDAHIGSTVVLLEKEG